MFNNLYLIFFGDIILIIGLLLFVRRIRLKRIKKYTSKYSGTVEIKEIYTGEKRMFINLCTQGIAITDKYIDKTYWYELAKQTLDFCKDKENPQILILGLGANTESLLISEADSKIHQTIVEYDEVIVDACKSYFGLDRLKNYTLLQEDAYEFIKKEQYYNQFDVIIIDILTGEQTHLEYNNGTDSFVNQVRKLAKPEALLLFNSPAHVKKSRSHTLDFLEYLTSHFSNVSHKVITYPSGFNNYAIKVKLGDDIQNTEHQQTPDNHAKE